MVDKTAAVVSPQWPFDIRRLPFYYGWVIWLFSTAGIIFSIPGQTMGMAVFTDHLIEALGLSRTQLSMAYLVGTVCSSLFLTTAGRWYDRLGGRVMVALASALLALMLCVYLRHRFPRGTLRRRRYDQLCADHSRLLRRSLSRPGCADLRLPQRVADLV